MSDAPPPIALPVTLPITLPITGGCLCGAVRYTIDEAPIMARTCWCRACQYLTGGSAAVNLFFHRAHVRIEGELAHHEREAGSGNHISGGFCPRCGTPVTTAARERPRGIGIRAGTLDNPGLMGPQMTIWTAAAPHWAPIDPAIPSAPDQGGR